MLRAVAAVVLIALLASCSDFYRDWAPVVDVANDPHADRLKSDTEQCRKLSLTAGQQEVGFGIGSNSFMTDDGDFVDIKAYRHAYVSCLKQRKHPVVTLMPAQQ